MWTREELKARAKSILKSDYWRPFIASLVIAFVGGGSNISFRNNVSRNMNSSGSLLGEFNIMILVVILICLLLSICIFMVVKICLAYPLEVGGRKFFIRATKGEAKIDDLGYCYSREKFIHVILTMLLKDVYLFLWFLLFIIPGIIKSYSYRMVPYILADNPTIGYKRAIQLSNDMTEGEKMKMFILDLSFLGWYLLGMLVCFIGVLFVHPYKDATYVELYQVLKKKVIQKGLTTYGELEFKNHNNTYNEDYYDNYYYPNNRN